MTNWIETARAATVSGTAASIASTLALAGYGQRDCASVFAPINAISHWVWRDRAIGQDGASLRYTITGYLIHHAMSVFWAAIYEADARRAPHAALPAALRGSLAVAALACVVDLECTPERLTPGFERRLGSRSLLGVYLAFGLGLALPRVWRALRP